MTRRFVNPLQFLALLAALGPIPAAAADPPGGARLLAKLPGPAGTAAAFSRDGKLLLTAGGDEARVWDAGTFEPVTPPLGHVKLKPLSDASISPDGKTVATAAGGEVDLWSARTGERLATISHAASGRLQPVFSPDGTKLLTIVSLPEWTKEPPDAARDDQLAKVWDVQTGKLLFELEHPWFVGYGCFGPNGNRVATFAASKEDSWVGSATLWDAGTGRNIRAVGAVDGSRPVSFSADGRRLAVAGWYRADLLDGSDGKTLLTIHDFEHQEVPTCVSLSPDGSKLVTILQWWSVRCWDTKTGKPVGPRIPARMGLSDAIFSNDGRLLLTPVTSGSTSVWDVRSGQRALTIDSVAAPLTGHAPAAAFSPDGKRLAVGFTADGFTGIWELPDHKQP